MNKLPGLELFTGWAITAAGTDPRAEGTPWEYEQEGTINPTLFVVPTYQPQQAESQMSQHIQGKIMLLSLCFYMLPPDFPTSHCVGLDEPLLWSATEFLW